MSWVVLNEGHSHSRRQPGVPMYLAGGRPRPAGVSGRRVTRRCRPGEWVVVAVVAEANFIFRLTKHAAALLAASGPTQRRPAQH